jgi:hypothetical protein
MQHYEWPATFREIYDRAVKAYQAGGRNPAAISSAEDQALLASIGCTAQELYDFVDDRFRYGEPSFETTLLVTAVRREYFLTVQRGRHSQHQVDMDKLPAKSAQLGGIPWLPRLIEKAKAKLRGEMPPDLMYCCGGDREFLNQMNIDPAEFLRFVWAVEGDQAKVLEFVRNASKR